MEFRTVEPPRILVTGATGFLGFRVVAALLEGGASVSVLVRPDQHEKVAAIANRVHVVEGDIWNRASLKGLARGYNAVVHLVGSIKSDPARGLTYQQINLVSARHVIGMAVSDGVLNFVLLSATGLPAQLPVEYIRSKRDAEDYLKNSGLEWVIVRAPLLFEPSFVRTPLLSTLSTGGVLPPISWFLGGMLPLPVDIAARGIASATLEVSKYERRILYANDLRRLARSRARGPLMVRPAMLVRQRELDLLDETPFGWSPPASRRKGKK